MRSLRVGRQQVQHFPALVFALELDAMSEHKFRAGLVGAGLELELAAFIRFVDRPSGENLRDFGDVALRIAAIHTERVELEEFASVIFIQSAVLFSLSIRVRVW